MHYVPIALAHPMAIIYHDRHLLIRIKFDMYVVRLGNYIIVST